MSISLMMVFVCGCGDDGFKDAINNEIGDSYPTPGNSGIVAASYTAPAILDVNWQDARDDLTAQPNLKYRVFASMSSFSSVQEAERGGTELTAGWTLGISSIRGNIPSGTLYSWCNVFVSDENDNISIYRGVAPSPYANTAPATDGNSLVATSSLPLKVILSWTKATDLQTPQTSLRYRVFCAGSPSDVNTFAHAESGGTEITSGWTYDIGTIQASVGEGGVWWFNVFVIDGGGLVSGYVQRKVTVAAKTPPVITNSTLALSPTPTSVRISWIRATDPDGETPRDLLQYRIYCSITRSALESDLPPSPDAATDITRGWITFDPSSTDTLSYSADGLASGTIYFFRTYVRDLDLMISAYGISGCSTAAATYPSPGGGGVITAVPKADKKINLAWTAASDPQTAAADLLYCVYSSEVTPSNNAYGDIATIEAATSAISNGSTTVRLETLSNTSSGAGWVRNITSLCPKMDKSTTYYFNVFVKDGDGQISAYIPVSQKTTN